MLGIDIYGDYKWTTYYLHSMCHVSKYNRQYCPHKIRNKIFNNPTKGFSNDHNNSSWIGLESWIMLGLALTITITIVTTEISSRGYIYKRHV